MAIAYQSDKGPKRAENQDAVGAFYNKAGEPLVLVADGVASQAGSKRASELVVSTLGHAWEQASFEDEQTVKGWLVHQADLANQAILLAGQKDPEVDRMATTLVLAVCLNGKLLVANAGDSRAYLLHKGKARLLTFDHTLRNELERKSGQVYEESLPDANSLTRYLGVNKTVDLEWTTLVPEKDDWLYLTSDGLSKVLSVDEQVNLIQPGVSRPGNQPTLGSVLDLSDRLAVLAKAALARRVPDNITALLMTDLTNPKQKVIGANEQEVKSRLDWVGQEEQIEKEEVRNKEVDQQGRFD
ncbi:protein phosphatase 2C domain-containing protein [Fructobacillus sp. W13]|uniref:Protein phosphatase 2C domain-containing protein n=1 Tax=Fructobacillus apis TaxID=2935017 RepID=A0ABT0ZQG5_9LACO|nr:protein phosphatase 2C domain-containing protein [Fructobacillus apis]MCO0832231.1 protein phosphatase 2C domain-containing protein [Fructobacillus apis]